MKLQCEVSVVGKRHELHVPGNRMAVDDAAVEHDAMAAHALLQAMGEADEQDGNVSGQWGSCIEQIRQRAAEILAGWLGEEVK